jgi:hypothetical protein
MLLPRELDMVEAGKRMPLPVPKPVIPEAEVKKENAKVKATAGRGGDHLRTPASARKVYWQAGPARPRPRS